jgi:hypothetical protein
VTGKTLKHNNFPNNFIDEQHRKIHPARNIPLFLPITRRPMPTQINNRVPRYERRPQLFSNNVRRMQAHFDAHAGDLFVGPDKHEFVVEIASFRAPQIFTTNRHHGPTQAPRTDLVHRPFVFPDDDDQTQTHEQRVQLLAHSDEVRQAGRTAIEQKVVLDDDTRHALAIRDLLEFTEYSEPNPTRAVNCLLLRQDPQEVFKLAKHPILAPFNLASLKTLLTFGDLSLACGFLVQLWQKKHHGSITVLSLTIELEKMRPARVAEILSHLIASGQKELANQLIKAGLDLPDVHPDKCRSVVFDAYITLQQQHPETYLPIDKITAQTVDFVVSTLPQDLWWTLREMPELLSSALKHGRFVREIPPALHDAFSSAARTVICDCLAKPFTDEERIAWKRLKNNLMYLQQARTPPEFFRHFLDQDLATFGLKLVLSRQEPFSIRAKNETEQPALILPQQGQKSQQVKPSQKPTTAITRARRVPKAFSNPNDVWKAEILSLIAAGEYTLAAEFAFFPLSELPKRWPIFSTCLDPAITAQLLASLIQVDYVVQVLQALFTHVNNYDPDLETEVIQILEHLPLPGSLAAEHQITLDDMLIALLKNPTQRSLGVTILVDALFYGSPAAQEQFTAAYDRVRENEDWYPLPYVTQTGRLSVEDSRQIMQAANEASYQAQAIKAIQTLNANPSDSDAIKDTRKLLKNPLGPTHIKQMLTQVLIKAAPDKLKTIQKLKNKKNEKRLREMVAAKDNNSIAALMALMEIKADLRGLDIADLPLADDRYRDKILAYLEYTIKQLERSVTIFAFETTFQKETISYWDAVTEYNSHALIIDQLIPTLAPKQKYHLAASLLLTTVRSKNPIVKSYGGYADKWFGDIPKAEILVEVSSMKAANLIAGEMVLECLGKHSDDIFTEPDRDVMAERFEDIIKNIHTRHFYEPDAMSDADIKKLTDLADALEIKLYTRLYAILSPEERVLFLKDQFKRLKDSGRNLHFAKSVLTNVWPLESLFTSAQKASLTLDLLSHFEEMTTETRTEMLGYIHFQETFA